jgi:cyanophycin synthetase
MKLTPYLSVCVRFEFAYTSTMRSASVDAWLRQILPRNSASSAKLTNGFVDNPCANYMLRVLDLGRLILELWKIPVFESAKIEKILPNLSKANSFKCEIVQPVIPAIPMEAYENAYLIASELCQWCCSNNFAKNKLNDFFALLEQRVKKNKPPFNLGGGSTVPVLKVAHQLNIPFFHLGRGIYQLGTGSKARFLDRSHGEGDGFIGVALSGHKATSARILRQHGLPTPLHFSVFTQDAAIAAAKAIGYPVVMKPVDANRGEGVTVGVNCTESLSAAFDHAKRHTKSGEVLIEQQIAGICHRLFIVKGRLLYAVKRLPLFVTGDGVQTVRQLVNAEVVSDQARPHWQRNKAALFDEAGFTALAKQGTRPDSVPGFGERIFLRPIETTQWGGIDEDTSDAVHPQNLKAAVEAAKAFNLEVAGVDMISTDISIPWTRNGAVITEVNGGPLLGGGEVSRSHIESFLEIYLEGTGCIDIVEASPEDSVMELLGWQANRLEQGSRSWIVFSDVAIGPAGQELQLLDILPEEAFDTKGQALRYSSAPEEILLLKTLHNRNVDHVVRAKGRARASPVI